MHPGDELPLTFTEPRWRAVLIAGGSLVVIVGMGVIALLVGEVWLGVMIVGIGAFTTAIGVRRVRRPAVLTLDEGGLTDRCYPRTTRRIAWDEIERIEVVEFPRPVPLHSVGLVFRPGAGTTTHADAIATLQLRLHVDDMLRSATGSRRRAVRIARIMQELHAGQDRGATPPRDGERPSPP